MRAIRFGAVGADPTLTDVPIPEPLAGQVRVAMRACGICGSDLHVIDGSTTVAHQPITMGHEPSGVIDAVGDGVDTSWVGQCVVVNPLVSCGQCRMCRAGSDNLCLQLRILGIGMDGAHAEFFLAPADNVVPLPENVDFATGAVVTDAVATPMHAIRLSGLRAGDTAAVFGLRTPWWPGSCGWSARSARRRSPDDREHGHPPLRSGGLRTRSGSTSRPQQQPHPSGHHE